MSVAFRSNDIIAGQYSYNAGDQWTATIQGAPPNSPVWFISKFNNGTQNQSQVGMTDGNGAFTYNGGFSIGDVGNWWHDWEVGPQFNTVSQGSYSFTVGNVDRSGNITMSQSVANQTTTTAPSGGNSVNTMAPPVDTTNTTNGTTTTATSFLDQTMFGIPDWLLLAGAVAVGFMMMGGEEKHRRGF